MTTERMRATDVLGELQAAEVAGASALEGWIATCHSPGLRGGLRVIHARDCEHARLAQARLAELGVVRAPEPSRGLQALCASLADPVRPDQDKLATLVGRLPRGVTDPLADLTAMVTDDEETRAMLEEVSVDDAGSLTWLRTVADVGATPVVPLAPEVLRALDALRAAEAAGAVVVATWLAVAVSPGLRGVLRVVGSREAVHAAVLDARLHELGWSPSTSLPEAELARACERFGSRSVPDGDKITWVAAADAGTLAALIDACADDAETQEILRLVASGEAASATAFARVTRAR